MTAIRVSAISATDISTAITFPIGHLFYHFTISAVLVTCLYFIPLKYSYQLFLYAYILSILTGIAISYSYRRFLVNIPVLTLVYQIFL